MKKGSTKLFVVFGLWFMVWKVGKWKIYLIFVAAGIPRLCSFLLVLCSFLLVLFSWFLVEFECSLYFKDRLQDPRKYH